MVYPPAFDSIPGVFPAEKPVLVQALIPQSADEALSVGIFDRLARSDELQLQTFGVSLLIKCLAGELGTAIQSDDLR